MKNIFKKFLFCLIISFCLFSVTACMKCKKDTSKIKITVWGAVEHHDMLKDMIEKFKQQYETGDITFEIRIDAVSEADVFTQMQKDVTNGADVYAFPHDQLANLVRIGGISAIGGKNLETIKKDNTKASIDAGKAGEYYYGYPLTADNGYFLYYDKSKISNTQAESLEGILAACEASNSKFVFDLDNSWYDASFFFGAGCSYDVKYDKAGTTETEINCNFNNENGVIAGKAMIKLANHKGFLNGGDDEIKAGFADGSVAAGVTGTWNATAIQNALKENYYATKLPTFTENGKTYQMSSFSGYKLIGVNPHSKNLSWAHTLALFLTNETNQTIRFEKFETGPTNIKASENEKVKANIALSALAKQNEFAIVQQSVPSNYWTAVEAFGTGIVQKEVTSSNLQDKLNQMVDLIKSIETTNQ